VWSGPKTVKVLAAGALDGVCDSSSVRLVDEKAGAGIQRTKLRLGYSCVWADEGGWSPLGNQP